MTTIINRIFISLKKHLLRLFLPVIILLTFSQVLNAQLAVMGGVNFSSVKNNNLIQNQESIVSFHAGGSFRYYPFANAPKLSILNEIIYTRKGYDQTLDRTYEFRFNYISFPMLLNYQMSEDFSLSTGVELSGLLSTNKRQGNLTYNTFDMGLVAGFSCFDSKTFNLYARVSYGIMPMLDYYDFDKLGNFTSEIRDLRNVCFSIGTKINLYDDKIRF